MFLYIMRKGNGTIVTPQARFTPSWWQRHSGRRPEVRLSCPIIRFSPFFSPIIVSSPVRPESSRRDSVQSYFEEVIYIYICNIAHLIRLDPKLVIILVGNNMSVLSTTVTCGLISGKEEGVHLGDHKRGPATRSRSYTVPSSVTEGPSCSCFLQGTVSE